MSDDKSADTSGDNPEKSCAPGEIPLEHVAPKEVQTAIRKLAENKPEKIFEMMAVAGMGVGNPLHQKMEPQHITQVLDLAAKHDEREFELYRTKETNGVSDRSQERRYIFSAFVILVVLILVVLFLFKDQPAVLVPCLTGIGGMVGGFAGGFGLGKGSSK